MSPSSPRYGCPFCSFLGTSPSAVKRHIDYFLADVSGTGSNPNNELYPLEITRGIQSQGAEQEAIHADPKCDEYEIPWSELKRREKDCRNMIVSYWDKHVNRKTEVARPADTIMSPPFRSVLPIFSPVAQSRPLRSAHRDWEKRARQKMDAACPAATIISLPVAPRQLVLPVPSPVIHCRPQKSQSSRRLMPAATPPHYLALQSAAALSQKGNNNARCTS